MYLSFELECLWLCHSWVDCMEMAMDFVLHSGVGIMVSCFLSENLSILKLLVACAVIVFVLTCIWNCSALR